MVIDSRAMVEAIIEARNKVERLEIDLTAAKDGKLKAEAKLIEVMDLQGIKSTKIETSFGLMLAVKKETLYVSVKAEDREQLLKWVDEDCGRSDLIKQTIHNKSLEGFVNQRLKDAEPVPSFISTYFKPGILIRKGV
uniref:Uncharacterized protein n=1 Tax=viral metagenome TaxID=1070528 RepID=A0A6M3JGM5_9ZZZZ